MSHTTSDAAVVIVGAGPAGLFAACELMRHGVRPRIIEKRTAPHRETRGTAIQPAVLELLQRAGLIEPFLERSIRIRRLQALGHGMGLLGETKLDDIDCAYPFQCSLPQCVTEDILRQHLAAQGVAIEFGAEVVAITETNDGLDIEIRTENGEQTTRAAYVLGAGGAGSVTRHSMQETLSGETYAGAYVVADVRLTLARPPETGAIVVGADGLGLLSPLPDGRWLIFINLPDSPDGSELPAPPEAAALDALLSARLGVAAGLHDVRWASCFRMHRRAARRLGDRRRFLLGDAGHLSSPLGGEGVNAALMDGGDIAWKLALVLRGQAPASLLDSYAIERGMADAHVLGVSDEIHASIMGLIAGFQADAPQGAAAPDGSDDADADAERGITERRSMLTMSYHGSPLIDASRDTADEAAATGVRFKQRTRLAGTGHHVIVFADAGNAEHAMQGFAARWGDLASCIDGDAEGFSRQSAGLAGGGVVLVRPDGIVAMHMAMAGDVSPAVAAADRHLSRYLIPAQTGDAAAPAASYAADYQ